MAARLGSGGGNGEEHGSREGTGREQTGKKEYIIFKGEKERKTPTRLAKAYKCAHIHFT